jgi:hypothetical protein
MTKQIAPQHDQSDEPPEWPAPNRHLSQSTRHVADRCGLGLDPGALGGHGGALGLEGGPGPAIWLAATTMPDMPTLSYRAYPLGSENRLIVGYRADASSSADLRRRSRNTGMSSRSGGGRVGDEAAVSFGGSDAGSGTEEGDGAVSSTGASRLAVAPAGGVGGRTLCPFAASGRAGLGASLLVGTPLCSPFRPIPPFESATAPQCPSLLVCGTFKSATMPIVIGLWRCGAFGGELGRKGVLEGREVISLGSAAIGEADGAR